MIMINEDLIKLAQDFNKWLEDMSEKYNFDKDDIQELIHYFLS